VYVDGRSVGGRDRVSPFALAAAKLTNRSPCNAKPVFFGGRRFAPIALPPAFRCGAVQ
jgi:hypothetical protein